MLYSIAMDVREGNGGREKLSVSATAVVAALALVAVKGGAGFATGSVGVLASALDSLLDAFTSSVNYFSIRTALKPADEDHPFGHGKAESLAGFFQSFVILGSGLFLIAESVRRLFLGAELHRLGLGVGAMFFSTLVTLALVLRLGDAVRATGSIALKADYYHYMPDLLTHGAVLLGLAAAWAFGWSFVDPLLSLGISVYLLANAGKLFKESVDVLMDRELPPSQKGIVEEAVASLYPKVLSFHGLKTRRAGDHVFVEMHVEICEQLSFREAHDITEDLITALEKRLAGVVTTIHADPCVNCARCRVLFSAIARAGQASGST